MSRRARESEYIRNIQQSGGSYHISIPISLMRELGWKERQKVAVKKQGKNISIKDWKTKARLK